VPKQFLLREISHVRQVPNDYFRRLFANKNLDLVVWYQADKSIHGFQFTYGHTDRPKVLTWLKDRGFSHARIDDGEESPLANPSPILVPDDVSKGAEILSCLLSSAETLAIPERELVLQKLTELEQATSCTGLDLPPPSATN
jgi:hypothetical protein